MIIIIPLLIINTIHGIQRQTYKQTSVKTYKYIENYKDTIIDFPKPNVAKDGVYNKDTTINDSEKDTNND